MIGADYYIMLNMSLKPLCTRRHAHPRTHDHALTKPFTKDVVRVEVHVLEKHVLKKKPRHAAGVDKHRIAGPFRFLLVLERGCRKHVQPQKNGAKRVAKHL